MLALLALLPTVVVPSALLVDAWRAHQRLGSAAAELEQRLDGLRESQELRDLEIQRLTLLTEELLAAAMDDRRPGADRVGRTRSTWSAAPPLVHRATRGGAPTPKISHHSPLPDAVVGLEGFAE